MRTATTLATAAALLLAGCAAPTITAQPAGFEPSRSPFPRPATSTPAPTPPPSPDPVPTTGPSALRPVPSWRPSRVPVAAPDVPTGPPQNVPKGVPIPECGNLGPIITMSRWDAATGSRYSLVSVVNCTDDPVILGRPTLRALDSTGRDRVLELESEAVGRFTPLTIQPRQRGYLTVRYRAGGSAYEWQKWAHTLVIEVPGVASAMLTDHTDLGDDSPVWVVGWSDNEKDAWN